MVNLIKSHHPNHIFYQDATNLTDIILEWKKDNKNITKHIGELKNDIRKIESRIADLQCEKE